MQCTPQELVVLVKYFKKAAVAFESFDKPKDIGFNSDILNNIIYSLVNLQKPIKELEGMVLFKEALQGNKHKMYADAEKYPELQEFDAVGSVPFLACFE
jgi:DNA mismatch repair protein MSH3